jgi:hypothetical protein
MVKLLAIQRQLARTEQMDTYFNERYEKQQMERRHHVNSDE